MKTIMNKESNRYIINAEILKSKTLPFLESQIHTNWTDGEDSVQKMYDSAIELGINTLIFSEHSRENDASWFAEFASQVKNLPDNNLVVLLGTEVRIKNLEGEIAIDPKVHSLVDVILGSVHRFPSSTAQVVEFKDIESNQAVEIELKLMLKAVERGEIDILAHPFGMSISKFGIQPSHEEWNVLIDAIKSTEVCIEINSKYHTKFLHQILKIYLSRNVNFTLGSDAHSAQQLGQCYREINRILKYEL